MGKLYDLEIRTFEFAKNCRDFLSRAQKIKLILNIVSN